jgi:hypothetical protein
MTVERVYSVWDYYDGVLSGVADFRGSPHYFEKNWSEELRDYLPACTLIPVTAAELAEVIERERVYREWEAMFHRGEVDQSTHPGEAGQGASYQELRAVFKARRAGSTTSLHSATPEFSSAPGQSRRPKGVMAILQVEWHDVA